MKKKDSNKYIPNETDLTQVPPTGQTGYEGYKAGRTLAGKGLSDTRSSGRKGRKSSDGHKKLEEEAE